MKRFHHSDNQVVWLIFTLYPTHLLYHYSHISLHDPLAADRQGNNNYSTKLHLEINHHIANQFNPDKIDKDLANFIRCSLDVASSDYYNDFKRMRE